MAVNPTPVKTAEVSSNDHCEPGFGIQSERMSPCGVAYNGVVLRDRYDPAATITMR